MIGWSDIPSLYKKIGVTLATIGALYAGTVTALGDLKPIVDSGPMPLASREEVVKLGDQLAQLTKQSQQSLTILQRHDDYLMREALANDFAKWQGQYVLAQEALRKNPHDPVAKALRDIAERQMKSTAKALGIK